MPSRNFSIVRFRETFQSERDLQCDVASKKIIFCAFILQRCLAIVKDLQSRSFKILIKVTLYLVRESLSFNWQHCREDLTHFKTKYLKNYRS